MLAKRRWNSQVGTESQAFSPKETLQQHQKGTPKQSDLFEVLQLSDSHTLVGLRVAGVRGQKPHYPEHLVHS